MPPFSAMMWEAKTPETRTRAVSLPTTRADLRTLARDWEWNRRKSDPKQHLKAPFVVCCHKCLGQVMVTGEPDPIDRLYSCNPYWRSPYGDSNWTATCYRNLVSQKDVDSGRLDPSLFMVTVFPPDDMAMGVYPRMCKIVHNNVPPVAYGSTVPMTDDELVDCYRRLLKERRADVLAGRWKGSDD